MTPTPSSEPSSAARPTVYRGGSALFFGGIVAALCVASAVDLVVEAGTADLVGAAVLLVVAGIAVVFGPYPAAFSGEDGLRIRNPFRMIDLPWPVVTDVKTGLSFVVFTEQRKYTVYAIPVSLRDMRKADKQRYRDAARRQRDASRAGSGRGGGVFGGDVGRSADGPGQVVYHDQAVMEINGRREAYAVRLKREEIALAHGFTPSGKRIDKKADATGSAQAAEADKADKTANATAQDADAQPTQTPTTQAPTAEPAETAPAATVTWPVLPLAALGVPVLLVIIALIVK